jgi:ribosomal protein S12 methylthiotransferase
MQKTNDLIQIIRDKVPGITLRTTLIAGYPGESEEDFNQLKQWVSKTRFERLGIFTYSHEENTHAFSLKDDVSDDLKRTRASEIMDIQKTISEDLNESKVGQTFKVIIDRKEGNYFVGRTEADSPEVDNEVLIDAEKNYVRIGDFSTVNITSAEEFDLFGEVV